MTVLHNTRLIHQEIRSKGPDDDSKNYPRHKVRNWLPSQQTGLLVQATKRRTVISLANIPVLVAWRQYVTNTEEEGTFKAPRFS